MNWWRVELDESGAILKCDQVETGKIGSASRVTYVRANTAAEAVEYAKQWAEKKGAADRARNKRHYDERRAAGLCTSGCKRPPAPGRVKCAVCLAARKGAPAKPRKARTPIERLELARATARRDQYMRLPLTAVLREFDRRTPADFRNWLVREIAERDVRAYADMPAAAE